MARAGSYGKPGMGPKKGTGSTTKSSTAKTFGQAFKEARAKGVKTFTWKGDKFSTKTKEEVSKKATRKQNKATRTSARKSSATKTSLKQRMATRRKARVTARKNRRTNRALRKKS